MTQPKPTIKLLIVEDNPMDRALLEYSLTEIKDQNFNCTDASRLEQAIRYVKDCGPKEYDVVILDLGLPDSVGLETFIEFYNKCPNVSFIVMTGLDDDKVAGAALEHGAHDYLVKGSFEPDQLYKSIRYAINRRDARKRIEERVKSLGKKD